LSSNQKEIQDEQKGKTISFALFFSKNSCLKKIIFKKISSLFITDLNCIENLA
jgi:hypothetical protein